MAIDKDKLKFSLTLNDIEKILKSLGAQPYIKNNTIISDTICHNLPGIGSHKLYYYDNTKLFKCYTQCGDYFDIFDLISKAKSLQEDKEFTLVESVEWVANFINYNVNGFEFVDSGYNDILNHYSNLLEIMNKNSNESINIQNYNEDILKNLDTILIENWLQEGIDYNILKQFNIKYYPKDCKIVIPHYDINGNLIGIRGRTLIQEEAEMYGKYMPLRINGILYTHPLSFNLYGIHLNKDNIARARKAIVFEGEKSVMKYEKHFGRLSNIAVASCGLNFTQQQFSLLLNLGVEEIIIAFDKQYPYIGNNDEWEKMKKLYLNLFKKFGQTVTLSFIIDKNNLLAYKDAPIDKGKEIFIQLFKDRVFLNNYE